jgi:hypothetical protein
MSDIVKKVADQAPDRFFWLDIFLSAHMAVSSVQFSITVQANFLVTFFAV